MFIWINDKDYFVKLGDDLTFAVDEHGNAYRWAPEPGEHVGRMLYGNPHYDDPTVLHNAPLRALVEQALATGLAPVRVSA